MHLSRIIGITLLPLILTYCTNKETKEALASAESLMWVKPDSALTIMESIDTLRINGRASKALYSLLYSMALDRNHVVVTDSRIITQAVKYYERHGSPDDRFKSLCAILLPDSADAQASSRQPTAHSESRKYRLSCKVWQSRKVSRWHSKGFRLENENECTDDRIQESSCPSKKTQRLLGVKVCLRVWLVSQTQTHCDFVPVPEVNR